MTTEQKLTPGEHVTTLNGLKDYIYLGPKQGDPETVCLGRVGHIGALYIELKASSIKRKEWEIAEACVPSRR